MEDIANIEDKNALIAAAYFHAKFENIHPFSDGNGRTGRLLMNYFLLMHNHPPIVIHEEDRKAYYKALESFDEDIEIKEMVSFLTAQVEKTWENYLDRNFRTNKQQRSLADIIKSAEEENTFSSNGDTHSVSKPER